MDVNYRVKGRYMQVPCGQCLACRVNHAENLKKRAVIEMKNWKHTYFVTLTYADNNVKELNKKDVQDFLKRFRKNTGFNLKYIITGEYGDTTYRPHYHCIFFTNDEIPLGKRVRNGQYPLWTSPLIVDNWKHGQISFSPADERTIGYTVRYSLKKVRDTGHFMLISKVPGIGLGDSIDLSVYENDRILIGHKYVTPPKEWDKKLKDLQPDKYKEVKNRRYQNSLDNVENLKKCSDDIYRGKQTEYMQNSSLNSLVKKQL